ncbi:MAG: anti-sigma factor [Thermoleophilia bacterium]|nr:anti-sigma factor [Thermoleophilia bacterium]
MNHETQTPDEAIRELLVPYALRELEPADRARVERALEHDPDLRAELDQIEAAGVALVEQLPRHAAPQRVKSNVMAAVRASAQAAAEQEALAAGAPTFEADAAPARRPRRRWLGAPAFSAALAAACVVLAFVAFDLNGKLDKANDRADRLARSASSGADGAGGPPAGFSDATMHTVSTTSSFGSATGSLIRLSDDKWLLAFNDVPEPAKGRSWQVWTADSGGTIRNVAQWDKGETQLVMLDSSDIVEVMVSYEPTLEPAPAPSSAPVADVKV